MKNANIKSKTELATRLIAGEVFYLEGNCVHYIENAGCSPFRYGVSSLKGLWNCYHNMEVEPHWYEDLPKLCKVWNRDGVEYLHIITEYSTGFSKPFLSDSSSWLHAKPLDTESVKPYIVEL